MPPATTARPRQGRGDEPAVHLHSAGAKPAAKDDIDRSHEQKAIETIRLRYKGVQVRVTGLPNSRKVPEAQKVEAAELFGADPGSMSMSSLLWNCKEPAVKELRQVCHEISRVFHHREWTLPSNREGLRLIRRDALPKFHARMLELEQQLAAKAAALEKALPDIIERERERRGRKLFSASDYDFHPTQLCSVEWSFPSVVEDRELMEIDASVYHAEISRVRRELEQCVRLTEAKMAEDLYTALRQAATRLGSDADGEKLTFKSATVNKLFAELDHISAQLHDNSIGGEAFQGVSKQLGELLKGQSPENLPDALRKDNNFRQEFGQACNQLAETLLNSAVPAIGRRLLRRKVENKLAE